jgi:hypothetical protein
MNKGFGFDMFYRAESTVELSNSVNGKERGSCTRNQMEKSAFVIRQRELLEPLDAWIHFLSPHP